MKGAPNLCHERLFVGTYTQGARQVNQELGEIGGVFVSKQPSDTDMGAKAPRTQGFGDCP